MSFRATPLEQLNNEIAMAVRALTEREQTEAAIAQAKAEVSQLNARVRALKSLLRREERAFTKFDRITVPSLIAGVLGTRDRRRQEEYEQWLRVRQTLLQAMADRDEIVGQIQRLQAREIELRQAPQILEEALKRKETWLRAHDRDAMGRLRTLDHGERALQAELAKISLRLASSRNAQRTAVVNKNSVAFNHLFILQQLQNMKVKLLRQLGRERRRLLMDGAPDTLAMAPGTAYY